MKKILTAVALSMSLSACATMKMPTEQQIQTADYGKPVSQKLGEAVAKDLMHGYLKDPDSAKWSCQDIYKGWRKFGLLDGGKTYFGYFMNCAVNAKNSYGGYTGDRFYQFIFHDGTVSIYSKDDNGPGMTELR